ncbi:MAG: hypothetical protein K5905_09740 [Roseibium sp.]|uniref:hypothetical protein n=1 Tax=Roseibium sp. TaxID=1936156 RepID=UPI00260FCB80|nr:hypothetical protein [Roseibium sp.]MCV0425745.1 hypothetical protein [Roseibium sp.]
MTLVEFLEKFSIRDVSQIGTVDPSTPEQDIDAAELAELLRQASKIKVEGLTVEELANGGQEQPAPAVDVGLKLPRFNVHGDLILANITLPFPIYFEECKFDGFIEFWSSSCRSVAMYGCELEKGMDLRSSKIDGNLMLRKGFVCNGPLLLRDCTITQTLDLTDARFAYAGTGGYKGSDADGEAISLSRTKANALYWKSVRFPGGGKANLRDVSVKSFVNDIAASKLESWPGAGNLILDGFKYDRMTDCASDVMLNWIDLQKKVSMSSLANLASAYSNLNSKQNAEIVLVELKKLEIGQVRNVVSRLLQRTVFWLVGYGIYPVRALFVFLLMFFVFLVLAYVAKSQNWIAPNVNSFISNACFTGLSASCDEKKLADLQQIEFEPCVFGKSCAVTRFIPKHYPEYNPIVFSLEAFFPFVDFGQKKFWEFSNTVVRFLMLLLSYMAIFVGGVFVGGITGILTPRSKG